MYRASVFVAVMAMVVMFVIFPAAQLAQIDGGVVFTELLTQWASLAGVAAVIAILINILKYFGVVKDGTAPSWSTALNVIGLVGLMLLKIFWPNIDISGLDGFASGLANVLTVCFGFFLQLMASRGTHALVAGVPVIGTSYTKMRAKAAQL